MSRSKSRPCWLLPSKSTQYLLIGSLRQPPRGVLDPYKSPHLSLGILRFKSGACQRMGEDGSVCRFKLPLDMKDLESKFLGSIRSETDSLLPTLSKKHIPWDTIRNCLCLHEIYLRIINKRSASVKSHNAEVLCGNIGWNVEQICNVRNLDVFRYTTIKW